MRKCCIKNCLSCHLDRERSLFEYCIDSISQMKNSLHFLSAIADKVHSEFLGLTM